MRLTKLIILFVFCLLATTSASFSLNSAGSSLGQLYPVTEQSMLELIEDAAQKLITTGKFEKIQTQAKKQAINYLENPPAVAWISRAKKDQVRFLDTSVTLAQPIYHQIAGLSYPVGTVINPLQQIKLTMNLLLFDQRDANQVSVAIEIIKKYPKTYPILVAGSPKEFTALTGLRSYFDQHGLLASRLKISEVPAFINQAGNKLRVTTIGMLVDG